MPSPDSSPRRPRALAALVGLITLVALSWPAGPAGGSPTRVVTPVMGSSRVTSAELLAFYRHKTRWVTDARPAVPVDQLVRIFLEEGRIEGVAGDLAFLQAMVETGWLRHSERVPPGFYNYAGIGAVDGGTGAAAFPDARTGVRAQIQHLRAYADPWATCSNFRTATVTPRCSLVLPKGRASTWEQMGGGNWATDPEYGAKIVRLYDELLAHSGKPVK